MRPSAPVRLRTSAVLVAVLAASVITPSVVAATNSELKTTNENSDDPVPSSSVVTSEMDPDGLVESAQTGFTDFVASYRPENSDDDIVLAECPLLDAKAVEIAFSSFGEMSRLVQEMVARIDVDEFDEDGGESGEPNLVRSLTCDTAEFEDEVGIVEQSTVSGLGIGVLDSQDADVIAGLIDYVVEAEGVIGEPSVETFGGTLYGFCEPEEVDAPPTRCAQFWVRDTFVIGMYVIVEDRSATDSLAMLGDVLTDRLPSLLQRLATGLPTTDVVADEAVTDETIDPPCGDTEWPECASTTATTASR